MKLKNTALKQHLTENLVMCSQGNITYGFCEMFFGGVIPETSFMTRVGATITTFAGIGRLYATGLNKSREYFNIVENRTRDAIISIHDSLYSVAFAALTSPPLYVLSQQLNGKQIDLEEIAKGTIVSCILAAPNGFLLGYNLDISRDLTDVEKCERKLYPDFIKNMSPEAKKLLLAGAIASATTSVLYAYLK